MKMTGSVNLCNLRYDMTSQTSALDSKITRAGTRTASMQQNN
jgi:hypothetical protein